jgi:hypothetical protein
MGGRRKPAASDFGAAGKQPRTSQTKDATAARRSAPKPAKESTTKAAILKANAKGKASPKEKPYVPRKLGKKPLAKVLIVLFLSALLSDVLHKGLAESRDKL